MSNEDYSRYQREEGDPEIGATLKRARTEHGLSLEDVEQSTKIRKRYIAGLEEENYGELPAEIYLRGFLKTYADFLGLDGEEMVLRLKRLRPSRREHREGYVAGPEEDSSTPTVNTGGTSGEGDRRRRGPLLGLVALAVFVVAVIGVVIYLMGSGAFDASPGADAPNNGGEARENLADGGSAPTAPTTVEREGTQPETLRVNVSVVDNESWLVVSSDGGSVYSGLTQPGFQQTFEAEGAITIETGNAGAVKVEVNGQNYGNLGADGEVLTREFTLKDGA